MSKLDNLIKTYENKNILMSSLNYNGVYKNLLKIKIEYKDFKKYIYINKWNDFFEVYKKIKEEKKDMDFYEIIDDKCKFFININGYNMYIYDLEEYIQIIKDKLIEFFKMKLNLKINIIVYKDYFEKTYLRKLYRIVVQDYFFKIKDFKYLYEDFIITFKNFFKNDVINDILLYGYYNRKYSYIPYDRAEITNTKMFVTNIEYAQIVKTLNYDKIKNLDYFLSSEKKILNKYITENSIKISNLNELFNKKFIFVIKKNNQVLGLIVFMNNNNIKKEIMNIKYLHFENSFFYYNFIDVLFNRNIKKIIINDLEDKKIRLFHKTNINLTHNKKENNYVLTKYIHNFKENENNNDTLGYLYIIKEREFIKLNENIYKIGRTKDIIKRYKQYPKNSIIIYSVMLKKYHELEKKWLMNLNQNKNIINRNDIGREYFEGDYIIIINELMQLII